MSKSLSTIQIVFKVLRIISKVVFILCIVGTVGCAIGLLTLCFIPALLSGISDIIVGETGLSVASMCVACFGGMVVCASEAVIFRFSEIYFSHELEAGTPFTYEGSKEIFRLGIISIVVPFAVSVLLGIVYGIFQVISGDSNSVDFSTSTSIGTGLVFIFASVIFKYGAELEQKNKEILENINFQKEEYSDLQ